MEEIRYIEILKQAFSLTWKNKFLWFFGFLVFLGSISFQFNYNFFQGKNSEAEKNLSYLGELFLQNRTLFIVMSIALIVVALTLYVLKVLGSLSIIISANNLPLYRQMKKNSILVNAGKYFWRVVLLDLLLGFLLVAILFLVGAPVALLISFKSFGFAFIVGMLGVLIVIPLAVLLYFVKVYSLLNISLADTSLRFALESAQKLFLGKIKESLLMGLSLWLTGMIFWLALFLAGSGVLLVGALLGGLVYAFVSKIAVIVIAVIFSLPVLAGWILIASFFQAFSQVVWLIFFREISSLKYEERKTIEEVGLEEGVISNPEAV